MWVKGTDLAQCVGQGNWPGSQESVSLCGSRELTWQSGISITVWVKGTDLAVKNQHCCVGQGNWPGSQEPALLCGSRELTWQSRTSTAVWVKGTDLAVKNQHCCVGQGNWPGSQEPALLCGSRELTWQSRTSTAVWVKGTDLAVRGQHCCVGQGNWPGSQEPALLCGSRELTWQSRTSTAVWVKGTDLAVRGQHCCVGQGNWPGSQGPALLCGSRELTWQSGASTAVWVKGTDLAVRGQHCCVGQGNWPGSQGPAPLRRLTGAACEVESQHPHVGLNLCSPCYSPWMVCLVHTGRDQYRLPSHNVREISIAVCKDDGVGLNVLRPWADTFGTIWQGSNRSFSHSQQLVDSKHHSLQSHACSREQKHPQEKSMQHWPWASLHSLTLVQESENIQKKRGCSTDHAEVPSVASLAGDLADGAESAARVTLQLHTGVVLAWMPVACCHTPQHLYSEHLLFSKHNSLSHFNASSVNGEATSECQQTIKKA